MAGKEFRELTRAGSLNANGAMVTLSSPVEKLQAILVQNQNTQQEQECRVVNVWSAGNGKWCAGVEFTTPAAGFWEIYFPPVMRSRP